MQTSYKLVRVFDKSDEALGNQAAIFIDEKKSDLNELTRISADIVKDKRIATACFVSQLTSGHYKVQCFNETNVIQCCGHGLIAAAKTIFSDSDLSSININKNINASRNLNAKGKDVVVLTLPRMKAKSHGVPDWVNGAIVFAGGNILPTKAAVSDKEDGYLLLEIELALSLDEFRAMQLDLTQVCDNTQRAIVLLQFDKEHKHLYLRYFAPQYGVPEDSATGSVMRFVADYIEQNYQVSHFDVSQCSAQGGFMSIESKAENIMITANATIETI